eukprot:569773-Prorocentrum_minimum.AAC.1
MRMLRATMRMPRAMMRMLRATMRMLRAMMRMLTATFTTATGPGLSMMLSGSGVRERVKDANVRC